MVLTFDEVGTMLDEIAEEFPKEFYNKLNGGILLLPEDKLCGGATSGKLYTMGEYCINQMGRYINLYYGSFAHQAKAQGWSRQTWREELYGVLAHEFTHHMESQAGERGLEHKDAQQMEQMREGKPRS